jgi:hypothetical protein
LSPAQRLTVRGSAISLTRLLFTDASNGRPPDRHGRGTPSRNGFDCWLRPAKPGNLGPGRSARWLRRALSASTNEDLGSYDPPPEITAQVEECCRHPLARHPEAAPGLPHPLQRLNRLSPATRLACDGLEKAAALQMLNAIDDAVDLLQADPSSTPCRRRSFGGGLWAIPIRDRHDDWLIVREHDPADGDVVRVRDIGADPFA